ncbi:MAG: OpgC family protein [Actinomycetota bacterium]
MGTLDKRDWRVDFFRGLSLLFIFIDHISDNPLRALTSRHWGFADGAEVFVFLSGYSGGMAYGGVLAGRGAAAAWRKVGARWLTIAAAHYGLFGAVVLLAAGLAAATHDPFPIHGYRLWALFDLPQWTVPRGLGLAWLARDLDILPLYIAMLPAVVPVLVLARRRPWWAFSLSAALYGAELASATDFFGPTWSFDPLSWQLLFVTGVLLGQRRVGARPPRPRWASPLAGGFAGLALAGNLAIMASHHLGPGLPDLAAHLSWALDKRHLAPLRFLDILALAYLAAAFVPMHKAPRALAPVTRCGRHSLALFCLGVLLSFAGNMAGHYWPGPATLLAVDAMGLTAIVGAAMMLDRLAGVTRPPKTC